MITAKFVWEDGVFDRKIISKCFILTFKFIGCRHFEVLWFPFCSDSKNNRATIARHYYSRSRHTRNFKVKMGYLEIIFLLKTISFQMDFVVHIYFG